MNIFALDVSPDASARAHVDRHCVKMPLEYAQLLSTAHVMIDQQQRGYKATHVNHPSARWARLGEANYLWLYDLFKATSDEYTYRYDRVHKSYRDLCVTLRDPPRLIDQRVPFTLPWPAMPEDYKVPGNVIESYRNYYRDGKRHLHSWRRREPPEWL